MVFKTTKRKISKIQEQNIEDGITIIRQGETNSQIDIQFKALTPSLSAFKTVYNFEFDWVDLDFIDAGGVVGILTGQQYKTWTLDILQINEALIPYIKPEVLIKPKDPGTGDIDFIDNNFRVSYLYEVEDIPSSETLKHVILRAHFYNVTTASSTAPDTPLHQVKLLINFVNPMDFI